MAESERILVAVATYCERENLSGLVSAIRAALPAADVLITDDSSPDGTGDVADALAAADPRVRVIHRPGKLGLGTAILGAMRYALEHGYDHVITMDADFSHDPAALPDLVAAVDGHDVAIGSRYVAGGGVRNWPRSRQLMSAWANRLSRTLFRLPARDASGGFRCYRTSLLARAGLDRVRSRGYSFQQEVLYLCTRAGARVTETPITFEDRRAGRSKAGVREIVRSLWGLLRLGVPAFFRRRQGSRSTDDGLALVA